MVGVQDSSKKGKKTEEGFSLLCLQGAQPKGKEMRGYLSQNWLLGKVKKMVKSPTSIHGMTPSTFGAYHFLVLQCLIKLANL